MKKHSSLIFLEGKRVILRPMVQKDFSTEYLNWLNDPSLNIFSQRRPFPVSWESMRSYNEYYINHPDKGFVLAIIDKQNQMHMGNISLVNIQAVNRCGEIAILIGNKNYWNKGYAKESIYLLTRHGFEAINLNKIFAGSFNPAFVRAVQKNGWKKEGEFKQRIWANGQYHSQIWMSILASEFSIIPEFEKGTK